MPVVGGSWKGQGQGRLQEVSGIFHGSLWRMVALLCGSKKVRAELPGAWQFGMLFFWLVVIVIGFIQFAVCACSFPFFVVFYLICSL